MIQMQEGSAEDQVRQLVNQALTEAFGEGEVSTQESPTARLLPGSWAVKEFYVSRMDKRHMERDHHFSILYPADKLQDFQVSHIISEVVREWEAGNPGLHLSHQVAPFWTGV
jgi:hypothetical protein